MNRKGISSIIIILIIVGVLVMAGGVWYWQNQQEVLSKPILSYLKGTAPYVQISIEHQCDKKYNIYRSVNNIDWVKIMTADFKSYIQGQDPDTKEPIKSCGGGGLVDDDFPKNADTLYYKYSLLDNNNNEIKWSKTNSVIITAQSQDQTANWKTYRNEEYGFEIKYPNNWRFESDLSNNKISIIFPGGETSSPTLVIQFPTEKYSEILAKEERNFNEWQQESIEQPSGKINDITFAGTAAKEFLYYSPVGFTEQVIILSKSNQTIVTKSFKNSVLDPILSTFKFIK